jgi:hypothetical protein
MVILVFRGSKGEDLEVFLREYKKICIGMGLGTVIKGTSSHWFERQIEAIKGSWNDIIKALMKEFYVQNVYQNLIFELNQLKHRVFKLMRKYKKRTMTLQNKL